MKLQKIGEKRFQRSNYRIFERVQIRTNPVQPQNQAYDLFHRTDLGENCVIRICTIIGHGIEKCMVRKGIEKRAWEKRRTIFERSYYSR